MTGNPEKPPFQATGAITCSSRSPCADRGTARRALLLSQSMIAVSTRTTMMTTEERAALEAFVAGVRAHYGARFVDIFVFGSRARGDATPDSDVDLAIILQDGDGASGRRRLRRLRA